MRVHRSLHALVAAAVILGASASEAALTTYTTKAGFDTAIAGLSSQTVDFESIAAGTLFPTGTGTGGLTFVYSIAGPSTLQVSDTFGTTSGTRYLGLDNPDTAFYLGDSFTINFGVSVNAVGLYVITGSDAQAGDMRLSVSSGSVSNSAAPDVLVSDGRAFYLGLVESDPALGFTSAVVSGVLSTPNAFLAFSVDDITTGTASTVPEPGSLGLMLTGLSVVCALARYLR